MRIYLDEDCNDPPLAKLLRQASHDVLTPAEAGMLQKSDAVQLIHAVREQRTFITGNHDDFEDLHDLVLVSSGQHPGILVVMRDNNPARDMTTRGVVRAVEKLAAAMSDLHCEFQVLNQWR